MFNDVLFIIVKNGINLYVYRLLNENEGVVIIYNRNLFKIEEN